MYWGKILNPVKFLCVKSYNIKFCGYKMRNARVYACTTEKAAFIMQNNTEEGILLNEREIFGKSKPFFGSCPRIPFSSEWNPTRVLLNVSRSNLLWAVTFIRASRLVNVGIFLLLPSRYRFLSPPCFLTLLMTFLLLPTILNS